MRLNSISQLAIINSHPPLHSFEALRIGELVLNRYVVVLKHLVENANA